MSVQGIIIISGKVNWIIFFYLRGGGGRINVDKRNILGHKLVFTKFIDNCEQPRKCLDKRLWKSRTVGSFFVISNIETVDTLNKPTHTPLSGEIHPLSICYIINIITVPLSIT